ncbi:hypothetical protein Bb109J_c3185 [Bdellovibrio bacteriovorus]|uniref:hypothetical protein n=1 Tax=Bdellovibrio bacteriovorus TaxID=959 RepID=UPI00045BFE2B|nr:hypothetical protein [Bdellovibrio bacteriovorus]AHZ83792.1 hypothetical protein EP01_02365 [Bdellovibrio bacteriovorus]BEV69765.1 hypothetical protein Bb109J_c3185 [Bdellovibrio bacteriovorus]
MKFASVFIFILSFSARLFAMTELEPAASLKALRTECDRVEESFPDFACLRFEFYQSSASELQKDLDELTELNDWQLRAASWSSMMQALLSSMEGQIQRYDDADHIQIMQQTKSKNHWELLRLKQGLENFWVDPDTYWFPSVNAVSFVAVNITKFQILVISHGERN